MTFVKGKSGNPSGRPARSPEEKLIFLSRDKVARQISEIAVMAVKDLEAFANDPNSPALKAALAKVLLLAKKIGSEDKLEFLLNRSIGKVPQPVEVADVSDEVRDKGMWSFLKDPTQI